MHLYTVSGLKLWKRMFTVGVRTVWTLFYDHLNLLPERKLTSCSQMLVVSTWFFSSWNRKRRKAINASVTMNGPCERLGLLFYRYSCRNQDRARIMVWRGQTNKMTLKMLKEILSAHDVILWALGWWPPPHTGAVKWACEVGWRRISTLQSEVGEVDPPWTSV